MIQLLNSAFLLALPLVALPVLIHLLNRRRQRVIRWGAMRFLLEVTRRQRRLWRWRDWLLMALRAVAVLLIVLAVAQPKLRLSWFGSESRRDVILVLDTSLSTARRSATAGYERVFDQILGAADGVVDSLQPADSIRVLLASSSPRWLLPLPTRCTPELRAELRGRLHELAPTLDRADLLRCVQEAVAAENAEARGAAVIVLTDDQAYSWRASEGAAWRQLRAQLETAGGGINVTTFAGPPQLDNLAVDSLSASRAIAAPGEPLTFIATVRNTGNKPVTAATLAWTAGGESLGVTPLPALQPGETATARLAHAFESCGVHELACALSRPDDLGLDNAGAVVVEVVEAVPLLVVAAAAETDPRKSATAPFLAALGRGDDDDETGWQSVFRPTVVDAAGFSERQLAGQSCVFLADVPPLAAGLLDRLKLFVQQGGGLWIALSDDSDPASVSGLTAAGLLPAAFLEAAGDAGQRENFIRVRPPRKEHPATALLADAQRLDIDRAQVYRRHPLQITADATVLLASDDGSPLAVEQAVGRGRVILQGFPLGLSWSNLPLTQAYVVLVHEWLWYLAGPSLTQWNLQPGEALIASLPSYAGTNPTVTIVGPDQAATTGEIERRDSGLVLVCRNTMLPGGYRVRVQRDDKADVTEIPFQVKRDARESNLEPLAAADAQALVTASGLRFTSDPLALPSGGNNMAASKPVWGYLLAALLAMLLAELVLATAISRGRSPRCVGVQMGDARVEEIAVARTESRLRSSFAGR